MNNNLYKEIQTVFNNVRQELNNTTDTELNEIPFEGSWTIGQVAEHIIICSGSVQDNEVADAERAFDEKVEDLRAIFLNMEEKSKAHPAVTPKEPPHTKDNLLSGLEANKNNLLNIAATRDLTKLSKDMEFPFMGYLTRYEWLSFINVHTQRHLNQINNIKKHFLNANEKNN